MCIQAANLVGEDIIRGEHTLYGDRTTPIGRMVTNSGVSKSSVYDKGGRDLRFAADSELTIFFSASEDVELAGGEVLVWTLPASPASGPTVSV